MEKYEARIDESLPTEGIPVKDVFNENPETMETAPKPIKQDNISGVEVSHGVKESESHDPIGHSGMPHITEESIAYERIISGGTASRTADSSTGYETPVMAVPIEEVIGDAPKPAVMDTSLQYYDETPPGGQMSQADCQVTPLDSSGIAKPSEPIAPPRRSILDLFGAERKSIARKPRTSDAIEHMTYNPLSSYGLDQSNIDLPQWGDVQRIPRPSSPRDLDPEEYTDIKRVIWETEEPENKPDPTFLSTTEVQEDYLNPPKPEPRQSAKLDLDLNISTSETSSLSPWDYFYPPPSPPKTLEQALNQQNQRQRREKGAIPTQDSYDPYKRSETKSLWPWMYNRDELVELCTNHLMRDGKKATAEKIMQKMLMKLLEHYPRRHPVTLLAEALDRNAPILRNAHSRDGLKITITPLPLFERQRIRVGWLSLVKAAGKKNTSKEPFPDRLANEVIKVMEGKGAGIAFRIAEHKKAMANKLNVQVPKRRSRTA